MNLSKVKSKGKDVVAGLTLLGVLAFCCIPFCNKTQPRRGSKENPTELNADKTYTQVVVDVIDIKCLPDSAGMPHWFLIMKNTAPKVGYIFVVESVVTDYYNLLGKTLTMTTEQHPMQLGLTRAFDISEWSIDSIHK